MAFVYARTIHFPDTDAAGVVFFARYLAICHEAYEEALGATGINLRTFFADAGVVVPIRRSEADYLRPMYAGDKIKVSVVPSRLSENSFALDYTLTGADSRQKRLAVVRTEHVCIRRDTREREPLPAALAAWVDGGDALPAD